VAAAVGCEGEQVPAAQAVPRGWLKVNSTKKTTRYHPPEVLRAYDRLAVAKEATAAACTTAWQQLLLEFRGQACQELPRSVVALAQLDCLHSLAVLSLSKVSGGSLRRGQWQRKHPRGQ